MHIFVIVCGTSLIIASLFPIAVKFWLPASTKPNRWIQNCLPFSVFMHSAFPIAMGIFAVTIFNLKDVNGIDVFAVKTFGTHSLFFASIIALLFMFGFASVIVLHDFTSRHVGPYILRRDIAVQAFRLEKELRDTAKTAKARKRRGGTRRAAHPKSTSSSAETRAKKIQRYQSLVQLKSLRQIFQQGNGVAATYLGIAWIGCMCYVFYFWYVAVLVLSNQKLPTETISKLLTVFILLITWFPMRVHMDWYQNYFHNRNWLKQSNGLWLGIIAAGASMIFVIFITKPDAFTSFLSIATVLALVVGPLIGKFKPEWLRALADTFQSMPFVYFLGGYIIFLVVTVTIGIRILNT